MLVVDRLRQIFVNAGNPGLDQKIRASAKSVDEVRAALAEALQLTAFDAPRQAQLLALAYCWHDSWDAAHEVVQTMEGDPAADFIHAVLHRREGDADNARYWLARISDHPVFTHLIPVAAAEGFTDLVSDGVWRPGAFLARCLRAQTTAEPSETAALMRIQAAELLALLDRLATHPLSKPHPHQRSS